MANEKRVYYAGVVELEGECGVGKPDGQQRGQRYHLTQNQLRKLTPFEKPAIDVATGRTRLVEHDGTPYRFLLAIAGDATPGQRGLSGFGVRVGKTKNTYEVQTGTGVGTQTKRETLGTVLELTMEEALAKALASRKSVRVDGETPKKKERRHKEAQARRSITVRACLARYIAHLHSNMTNGTIKPSSVEAVRASLRRIERKEVGLADKEVRKLVDDLKEGTIQTHPMIEAWNACRVACMDRSNLFNDDQKKVLKAAGEWWKLSASQIEALGFKGRHIQRALSAGLAATEHTFGDIHRAIRMVIEEEADTAALERREPELKVDPTKILFKEGYFRDHTQLRAHYRKARVRNPLGEAEDDQSLQRTMKALIQRREAFTDPSQRVGVDYLFIVMLWGLRRNEGAVLRWYQDCTETQLVHEEVSWVWLAPTPEDKNPTTGRRGSQAFLHDTKTGVVQYIPIAYFAERILRWRWDDRLDTLENYDERLAKAKAQLADAKKRTIDEVKLALYRKAIEREEARRRNAIWVFPARSTKAKDGHYKDSKSLLKNLRIETGRLDLANDIDVNLTAHDFRRTMGRFASKHLSGRMSSELVRHFRARGKDGDDQMEDNTARYYSDQEWSDVRAAMATVEDAMIRTSPRVWNRLRGPDRPEKDEANDPPVVLAWTHRSQGESEEE